MLPAEHGLLLLLTLRLQLIIMVLLHIEYLYESVLYFLPLVDVRNNRHVQHIERQLVEEVELYVHRGHVSARPA